jgi:N-methylhydantoinase A/oxoprolinase/acetone carboxylase beta subunit
MWRVGVDVRRIFTDLFGWEDAGGQRVTAKVLTTKHECSTRYEPTRRKSVAEARNDYEIAGGC